MSSRIEQIVSKIKGQVITDLPALIQRDRALLTDVCKELGLAVDPSHIAQVFMLMKLNAMTSHEEYPKWVHPDGKDRPGVLVESATEEKAALTKVKAAPAAPDQKAIEAAAAERARIAAEKIAAVEAAEKADAEKKAAADAEKKAPKK